MRKFMTAATLAMMVGAAGAQAGGGYVDNTQYVAPAATTVAPARTTTAAASTTAGSVTLTDIPAGHWAREAVQTVVEAGLIQGFPDGTFRGNENLTRYQAAMIFSRLLQSGALSSSNLSESDLLAITRGMQEVSTELAAISSRLTDVERLTMDQQKQIADLQKAIDELNSRPVATETTATVDTTALTNRISDLEAQIARLEAAARTPAATTTVITEPAPVTPVPVETTTPVNTDPITIGAPEATVTAQPTSNMYVGLGGTYNPLRSGLLNADKCVEPFGSINLFNSKKTATTAQPVNWCGGVLGTVGSDNLYGPVGARVNVEYIPGRHNAVSADVNATTSFDLGAVQPYAGAGVGVVYGRDVRKPSTSADNTTDIYGNLLGGLDFRVAPNVGLFAEANGKYYFTRNTYVAQTFTRNDTNNTQNGGGFGISGRGGVKFFF